MILRAAQRRHDRRRKRDAWLTFEPRVGADPCAGFGALELLDEDRLQPGASIARRPRQAAEIITYVREGALAYEDSTGRSGVIHAGEFQRLTAGPAMRHSETNASRTEPAHIFQIWVRPSGAELEPGREQKRFSAADRRGGLCVIASPDARRGSLRIGQDALVYSAMLDPGQHVVHALSQGRGAWLHLVHGEVSLGDVVLTTGDGAGITADRAVSLTAREQSEILLFDLGEPLPTPFHDGGIR
ncbi:MAG TPA: pirin family protein [Kofleriaceae bacterium]|nr:pirin family protein [Kofleriaceae bacterium]